LKSFIDKAGIEGATVATYRDSFVKTMRELWCYYKDLIEVVKTIYDRVKFSQ